MERIKLPIHEIWSTDNVIFYQDGFKVVYFNKAGEHLEKVISDEKFVLQSIKNQIILRTKDSIKILDESFQIQKNIKLDYYRIQTMDCFSDEILIREMRDNNGDLVKYNLNTNVKTSIVSSDENFAQISKNNFIILNDEEFIKVFDLANNNISWQLDVKNLINSDKAKIHLNKVILNEEKVIFYVYAESWDQYSLFILDLKSGKTLYSSDKSGPYFEVNNNHIYTLLPKKCVIRKLNLNSFNYEDIQIKDQLDGLIFNSQCRPLFYENELLVALQRPDEDIYSFWGRINLIDKKVLSIKEELVNPMKKRSKENQVFLSSFIRTKSHIGVKSGHFLMLYENENVANTGYSK